MFDCLNISPICDVFDPTVSTILGFAVGKRPLSKWWSMTAVTKLEMFMAFSTSSSSL